MISVHLLKLESLAADHIFTTFLFINLNIFLENNILFITKEAFYRKNIRIRWREQRLGCSLLFPSKSFWGKSVKNKEKRITKGKIPL